MVKKTPEQVAAIRKAKKAKDKDKSTKFAGMKAFIDYIKEFETTTYKYIKRNMGLSDKEIYLRFQQDVGDPIAFKQLTYEAEKASKGNY